MGLGTLFKTKAESEKDRVFLYHENTRRTYAELFVRVRSLAAGLIEQGLRPGDIVASACPTARNSSKVFSRSAMRAEWPCP